MWNLDTAESQEKMQLNDSNTLKQLFDLKQNEE